MDCLQYGERIASRWTDGLIIINDEDFENSKGLGFLPRKNLFYVNEIGAELNCYSTFSGKSFIKTALGLKGDDELVTCVADFIPRKNH